MPNICRPADQRSPALLTPTQRESFGCFALFFLVVQVKWQNEQPPPHPGPSPQPTAALQHPELQPAGDTPVTWLHCVTHGCSCCWPCRRFTELLCLQQLPVPALSRPSPSHHPALPPEGWSGVLPPCVVRLAGAGSVGKGKVVCLGHTAGASMPAMLLLI